MRRIENIQARYNTDDPRLFAELPENSPRFVVLSYELHHRDGRTSFPLVLVYWAPQTSSMELSTLYTRWANVVPQRVLAACADIS